MASDKWKDIDSRFPSRTGANTPARPAQVEVLPPTIPGGSAPNTLQIEPTTILQRFRQRQMDRKLAVAQLGEYYDAKMELVKHQLKEAVRAQKAEATVAAEQYLAHLNRNHLDFLAELGLSNVDKRQETVFKLAAQTSRRLEEIRKSDWPEILKDGAIEDIVAMYRSFSQRLQRDLGDGEK